MKKHALVTGTLTLVILAMVVVLALSGCASFQADVSKVKAKAKAIDFASVQKYYSEFVRGLDVAATLTEAVAGNVDVGGGVKLGAVIETTVKPVIAKASDSVSALTSVAQAVSAGTASTSDVSAALNQVKNDVVAANGIVGLVQSQAKAISSGPTTSAAPATPPK